MDPETTKSTPESSVDSSPTVPEPVPTGLDRHECRACGYVYEPLKGDDRARIPANTAFEDLPGDWRCPVCSAPKKGFSNIGVKGAPSGFKENLGYGFGVNVMTPGQKNLLIFGALGLAFLFFLSLYGLQ
jgi:rubredoxin